MTLVRAYLRASTEQQDASRARDDLARFAKERGLRIAGYYMENASGKSLDRPELFRLLTDSEPGDILLVEQVDRLSRLNADDWERLKAEIKGRQVRVVALDLPTSWTLATAERDDVQSRILEAINGMMLDMLAAFARKDYDDRRRRLAQGQAKAKAEGKYKGRRENAARNAALMAQLRAGVSYREIVETTRHINNEGKERKVSMTTLARLAKRISEEGRAEGAGDNVAQA